MNEENYTWVRWKQPLLSSNDAYGIVTVSSQGTGKDGYFALDGIKNNANSCWESSVNETNGWLKWELPCILKIREIRLYNKYTGNTRLSKNVAVYADEEKTIQIGTQQTFPQESYSQTTFTTSTPIITSVIYIDMIDSYNLMVGLSEIEIDADIGVEKSKIINYLNTIEGMTLLASQQDDQTVSCVGANWFKYNSVTANTVYISGNSWIGFGTSNEHMKICRRDGKCYNLYRQEIEELKCIKFRWDGYSVYNSTANAYKLTWELFIFNNNDIFLNCISIPTNGTNSFDLLGGIGTFNLESNKYISMYCQDRINGKIFNLVEELYQPNEIKYIIKDDYGLYTVNEDNSSLVKLEETELSSSFFKTNGMDNIINGNLLKGLVNPTILEWHSKEDTEVIIKMHVKALPNIQMIIQNYDSFYNDETIKGISSIEVVGTINEYVNVRFAITFDNTTYYTFADNSWRIIDITNQEVFLSDGISKETLESFTQEQLESIFLIQDVFKFRFAIIIDYLNINAICNIEEIKTNFINEGV